MSNKDIADLMNLLFKPTELTPGQVMRDGSIYAGVSPEDGKRMFVMPGKGTEDRTEYPREAEMHEMNVAAPCGHDDWHLPTLRELDVLFDNSRKGKLSEVFHTASNPYWGANLYWSSTPGGLAYWRRPEGYDPKHWREQKDFKTGDYNSGCIGAHRSFVCFIRND